MRSEWKEYKLGDICSRLSSGKGIKATMISDSAEYAVYGGNGIRGYTSDYNFDGDCAIIGRQGAYCGNVRYFCGKAYMTEHAVIACANDEHNTQYLSYVLSSINLGRLSGQSAQPGLSVKTLSIQKVEMPPLDIQRKIVSVISTLEDKIKMNTEINRNLEQQAQAIFKSWFVDFEPFGGVMPDDFSPISVYDLADYINGAAFKKNEYGKAGLPIIKIAELKSGITDSTQYCCVKKDEKYYIYDKDILFSWSGNPETSIDTFLWSRGNAILNQHTFRVVSKFNAPSFTYFLLKHLKPQFTHIASNKQTTGLGHITVSDLKRLEFNVSQTAIGKFETLTTPIFERIYAIDKENQHLSAIRETLLPKLMNGEIDVSKVKI